LVEATGSVRDNRLLQITTLTIGVAEIAASNESLVSVE
jgi:hypothetical protein